MPTLWEMLTKKKTEEEETPLELQFQNPLQLRIGATVKLDVLDGDEDLSGLNFEVRQIREVKRTIEGQTFYFADYDLLGRALTGGGEVRKRLRLIPLEDPEAEQTHSVLLLNLLDEFGYDQPFEEGLAYDRNNGEFREGDAMYWRPDGIKEPWEAETAYIRDADSDGKVEEDEIKIGGLRYWDFGRDTEDEAGNTVTEWYLVEMDTGNGYFEIWIGTEINPVRVSV